MPNTNIADYIKVEAIELELKSKNKNSVIRELYEKIRKLGIVKDEDLALKALFVREEMGSTGIGKNVALPHAKTEAVEDLIITVGISREGIEYGAIDEENVNIFFMFVCPMDRNQAYLKTLARISRLIREDRFREDLMKAKTPEEIVEIISTEEK